MSNQNCLRGVGGPKCGQVERFLVTSTISATWPIGRRKPTTMLSTDALDLPENTNEPARCT